MEENDLDIELPPKLIPVFAHARGSVRYRGAYGGRGSGKSFTFAKMAAIFGAVEPLRILCCREYMNSIKESFHAEVKNAIASNAWLEKQYDVGVDYIRSTNGTEFIFRGLRNNISAIKSLAQIDICIIEEAEDVPEQGWIDLEPTIRAPKSEIWVIWNPRKRESAVNQKFSGENPPPRCAIAELNYTDNFWFPAELEEQRKHAQTVMSPELYAHVWEGAYLERSDAQIFKDKYRVMAFEPNEHWGMPYCGLDFGFSQDPTAAVKCWVFDGRLYIEHEAGKIGLELDKTQPFIAAAIPEFCKHEIMADSARPESISYLKRHGMPYIKGVEKGKGSVEDGLIFMQSFTEIVIHPRCVETIKEFGLYSYKLDRDSGRVTDIVVDANNHYIDAIRYALQPLIKRKAEPRVRFL
jgi:phage terminase large subunit